MLALNRSLLNRDYALINFLKALVSIISICNLPIEDYTERFRCLQMEYLVHLF
jgi:hypothetical protein